MKVTVWSPVGDDGRSLVTIQKQGCESACKKNPLFGVIGIQTGPRDRGPLSASVVFGSRGWDAGRGDDCKDTPGVFQAGQADQGDLPGVGSVSRKVVRKGDPVGGDRVSLPAGRSAPAGIGRWRDTLDQLLAQNEAKSSRERLTLIRLFEEYAGVDMTAATTPCAAMLGVGLQERAQATAAAFVPLSFAPGEAYQFDWSHEMSC